MSDVDTWVHTRSAAYEGRRVHGDSTQYIYLIVKRPAIETHRKTQPNRHIPAREQMIALPWNRVILAETLDKHGRRTTLHFASR